MNQYILQDAIGNISEDLIDGARVDWNRRRMRRPRFVAAMAACVAIVAAVSVGGYSMLREEPSILMPPTGLEGTGIDVGRDDIFGTGYIIDGGEDDNFSSNGSATPTAKMAVAVKISRTARREDAVIPLTVSYGIPEYFSGTDALSLDTRGDTVIKISLWSGERELAVLKEQSLKELIERRHTYRNEERMDIPYRLFSKEETLYIPSSAVFELEEELNIESNRHIKIKIQVENREDDTVWLAGDEVNIYFTFADGAVTFGGRAIR